MAIQSVTTKIISTLGNKESLIPIIAKDAVDSASLTYNAYKAGGTVEGIDRAFDEFGTQAIWIGGIPFFKKLYDLSAYKLGKLNPDVDIRVLNNKEYASWASENAKGFINKKGKTVKDAITESLKDGGKKANNLYKGKVIVATALTLGTYFALTKLKHKNTKNNVLNKLHNDTFKSENSDKTKISHKGSSIYSNLKGVEQNNNSVFSDINNLNQNNSAQTPSFKGIVKKAVDGILFNPVHNMKIIDAGITTERLACSRNPVEFVEHAIKEGAFLFTLYGLGGKIESGIDKLSDKVFNKPIELGIDVLMDKNFENALANNKILSDIAQMPAKNKSLTEKLNFIINNPNNALVQAAKKSKIVSVVKDAKGNQVIDTSKFINIEEFEALADKLKNIDTKFKGSNQSIKTYLNKTKAFKVGSVLANIGISCAILGYGIPKLVYKYREWKTGSSKFHVAEDIKTKNEGKKIA